MARNVTRHDDGSSTWPCQQCGAEVVSFQGDTECDRCHAQYNAFGQRLRDDWRGNPSTWDDEVSDLDGYEMQHADDY